MALSTTPDGSDARMDESSSVAAFSSVDALVRASPCASPPSLFCHAVSPASKSSSMRNNDSTRGFKMLPSLASWALAILRMTSRNSPVPVTAAVSAKEHRHAADRGNARRGPNLRNDLNSLTSVF